MIWCLKRLIFAINAVGKVGFCLNCRLRKLRFFHSRASPKRPIPNNNYSLRKLRFQLIESEKSGFGKTNNAFRTRFINPSFTHCLAIASALFVNV